MSPDCVLFKAYIMGTIMILFRFVSSSDNCVNKCPCNGIHTRHPSSQFNLYHMCGVNQVFHFKCPSGQYFDTITQVCLTPSTEGWFIACDVAPEPCRTRTIRSIEGSGSEGSGYFSEDCNPDEDINCKPYHSLFNP